MTQTTVPTNDSERLPTTSKVSWPCKQANPVSIHGDIKDNSELKGKSSSIRENKLITASISEKGKYSYIHIMCHI